MIQYEDDCVGCPQGCIDCGRRHTAHLYCDKCGDEFQPEELYDVEGEQLCGECILMQYRTVAQMWYG